MNNYFIGVGSNMGFRHDNILRAFYCIKSALDPSCTLSSIYSSPPFGFSSKNSFLNAVIHLKSNKNPYQILHFLKETEKKIHPQNQKRKGKNYCDRYIDLDILWYDGQPIVSDELTIPHPKLRLRDFALLPLLELHPDIRDPVSGIPLKRWLKEIPVHLRKSAVWKKKEQKIVCMEGNIGAGKTTLLQHLLFPSLRVKKMYEQFENNPWLKKFYENPEKYALKNECWFARQRYHVWKKIFPSPFSLTLCDYFFQKTFLFASVNLTTPDIETFLEKTTPFLSEIPQPDLIIYIHLPPNKLMEQIRQRSRTVEKSISVTYLEKIHEKYLTYFENNPHIPVLQVSQYDTSSITAVILKYLFLQNNDTYI